MRRVLFFVMVTIDGYYAGPNGEIDWHNTDDEFNEFAIEQLDEVDTLLFGRVTYEMMAAYWPTPDAIRDDPAVAGRMNAIPKIVFSSTMGDPRWQSTRLVRDNLAHEVTLLKQKPGKDLIIFGSSDLAASFVDHDLLDEARIMINPVVLGGGKPVLGGVHDRLKFKLTRTRSFRSGNILLYYQPLRGSTA